MIQYFEMSDHHLVRCSLEEAMNLARASRVNEAIARLQQGLNEARKVSDSEAASSLARHAGLLSFAMGNNQQAINYYREALATGQVHSALIPLRRVLELATEAADSELAEIASKKLEALLNDSHR